MFRRYILCRINRNLFALRRLADVAQQTREIRTFLVQSRYDTSISVKYTVKYSITIRIMIMAHNFFSLKDAKKNSVRMTKAALISLATLAILFSSVMNILKQKMSRMDSINVGTFASYSA